ncbi:hypothetical protein BTN49_3313 [Candidatus Enterovibrio escicola]|uniref:Uncharacterized protein n=1 Tax=Candidatus Enterovibrio escicola TaxID=1927127 RepID=A0A2A5SZ39_9GAMM|nr:hypothetical protein BTN49_3313 [Candidatus Enterovibrio escacola]
MDVRLSWLVRQSWQAMGDGTLLIPYGSMPRLVMAYLNT